jgi:tRNA pseudouridine55 synthase
MSRSTPTEVLEGALVIDKPSGRTSHDVVEAVRRLVGFRRIGHLGTLDPIATGVLVLLLGRATRLAQFYSARRKRYLCTVRFGFATDTYDAAGSPLGPDAAPSLSPELLAPVIAPLLGHIEQIPPPYSAKKIHGRPAHELARKHKPVELKPVEAEVYELRLLSFGHLRALARPRDGAQPGLRRACGRNHPHRRRRIHSRSSDETRGSG